MKNFRFTLFLFSILALGSLKSQLTFTITPVLCQNGTTTVTANPGTLTAMAYSWAALPAGAILSSATSASTSITFTAAGTFTVGVGILTPSGFTYATNTILINPAPALLLSLTPATICAGMSSTLTASGATNYTWSPSASLSTGSGSSVVASPASTTVYSVTGSSLGCSSASTLQLVVSNGGGATIIPTSPTVCAGFNSTLTAFGISTYTWTGTNVTSPSNQASLVVGPGSYSVSGFGGGCSFSAAITIGISPDLVIGVTRSSPTTCITNNLPKYSLPVHLTASGASSYVWFPFSASTTGYSIDARPASTTCYTVVGTTAACSGSAVICITVTPQFTVNAAPSTLTLCLNESAPLAITNIGSLAAGPASSFTYIWTEPLNAPPVSISSYFTPTVTVFPQNNCTYTVEVKDAANCISLPEMVSVTVLPCTGISEKMTGDNSVIVYPNPVIDKLYLSSKKQAEITVEILDALGKVVLKQTKLVPGDNSVQSISTAGFSAGIYFVKINANGVTTVKRLIKE